MLYPHNLAPAAEGASALIRKKTPPTMDDEGSEEVKKKKNTVMKSTTERNEKKKRKERARFIFSFHNSLSLRWISEKKRGECKCKVTTTRL